MDSTGAEIAAPGPAKNRSRSVGYSVRISPRLIEGDELTWFAESAELIPELDVQVGIRSPLIDARVLPENGLVHREYGWALHHPIGDRGANGECCSERD